MVACALRIAQSNQPSSSVRWRFHCLHVQFTLNIHNIKSNIPHQLAIFYYYLTLVYIIVIMVACALLYYCFITIFPVSPTDNLYYSLTLVYTIVVMLACALINYYFIIPPYYFNYHQTTSMLFHFSLHFYYYDQILHIWRG